MGTTRQGAVQRQCKQCCCAVHGLRRLAIAGLHARRCSFLRGAALPPSPLPAPHMSGAEVPEVPVGTIGEQITGSNKLMH